MNEHYAAAVAALADMHDAIEQLDAEHSEPIPNKRRVAQLYDQRNQSTQIAKIHALLAQVPASGVWAHVDSLCLCGHAQDDHERGLGACAGEAGPCGCPEFNL